jgi:phosphatidylserine/phosphatidylglycerophosphate/cardiolipin synthase-like enzyme
MLPSPEANAADAEYGPVRVDLRCDFPGAEILLVDGHQRLVARALESLTVDVIPGIYTARVRIGEALRETRIIARPDATVTLNLPPPAIASAVPLDGSATSHEYHQSAARSIEANAFGLHPDADSAVFVVLREWTATGRGQVLAGPLAQQLVLRAGNGEDAFAFDVGAAAGGVDRVAATGAKVRAGFYRLACRSRDAVIELPLYALANWHTHIYVMSTATPDGLVPDFARASIIWSRPGMGFDPARPDLRALESLRAAAESGRHHVTDRGLTDALYQKFENPMLGLMSAYALHQRKAIDAPTLRVVVDNLQSVIGPVSDVRALRLAVDPNADVAAFDLPPMLRWSWGIIVERTVERPELVPRNSLAEKVGGLTVGRGVWMCWVQPANVPTIKGSDVVPAAAGSILIPEAVPAMRWTRSLQAATSIAKAHGGTSSGQAVDEARLSEIVRLYGVPRQAIDEAASAVIAQQRRGDNVMERAAQRNFNERFLQRLLARRPQDRAQIEQRLQSAQIALQPEAAAADMMLEQLAPSLGSPRDFALETIVNSERPVLFVRDGKFDTDDVTALGPEAVDLVDRMRQHGERLLPLLPLIGRIDVLHFPGNEYLGTGWFVDTEVVVTNRHVASLVARWDGAKFAFSRGVGGQPIEASMCNAHEFDDLAPDVTRVFRVEEVLYIEPESGPNDIAFLRVARRTDGRGPAFIPIAASDAADELPVCVIGYPARASKRVIPDQDLMKQLYRDRYDIKRAAPGFTSGLDRGSTTHDCTTLGGNSGSVVLDLATGNAVGLHYAGLYQQDNFAVRATVLSDYIRRKRWNTPPVIEMSASARASANVPAQKPSTLPQPQGLAGSGAQSGPMHAGPTMTVTIPVTFTITVGTPQMTGGIGTGDSGDRGDAKPAPRNAAVKTVDVARVEQVLLDFWDHRPKGVLGARVGFMDATDAIGDVPCIAASVAPREVADFEAGGATLYEGVPIRYIPADVDEQLRALPHFESVDSISYDDDARTGERFSFEPVEETMDVMLHVGPEYSWEVLQGFLEESQGRLVSAMYEFQATHIKDVIEGRLRNGASLTLVLDNATFAKARDPEAFDRVEVFDDWARDFTFSRVVAPEGTAGLISDSYHIKVTVRDDDTFWLSSGNWKAESSQPVITQQQRDNATSEDLPGNREWHVVIRNKKLASRFRSHILQDFKRSTDLGGGPVSPSLMDETLVDVPIEEATLVEERRAPSSVVKPKKITKKVRVTPLLTPDREGAVFSEAALNLINSARESLLFQIPYIAMPSNPRADRGSIDELIRALTDKLNTLDDARVLLRSGGSRYSSPAHAAWYFKSKGVDIGSRLRVIADHHTKGMVVDGRRVLLGSHNWSQPGVTLNRDASLLFDDAEIAEYYANVFEIDWVRSNHITPRRFVKESVVLEAVGDAPPPGFRRVRLVDLIKDD